MDRRDGDGGDIIRRRCFRFAGLGKITDALRSCALVLGSRSDRRAGLDGGYNRRGRDYVDAQSL